MVLGAIQPVILLSVTAVTNLNAEQVESILHLEVCNVPSKGLCYAILGKVKEKRSIGNSCVKVMLCLKTCRYFPAFK